MKSLIATFAIVFRPRSLKDTLTSTQTPSLV